ncbi:MAG: hypothetical protein ACUVX9_03270 [Anaerolineae bacterium]
MLLTLDNRANPVIALRNGLPFRWLHRFGLVPYYVGVTYGPRRLRALLQQSGFKVGDIYAIMHCPRVAAVALARLLDGRLGAGGQQAFVRLLLWFEVFSTLPTRFLKGCYLAAEAAKP